MRGADPNFTRFAALQMVQVFLLGLTCLWCSVKSFIYDKIPCLPLQMAVGSGAAEAIKKVHGKSYTVGTSPDVLCKSLLRVTLVSCNECGAAR